MPKGWKQFLFGFIVPILLIAILSRWLLLLLVFPALGAAMAYQEHYRYQRGLCLRCGSDLKSATGKCPSCGLEFPSDRPLFRDR